MSFQVRFKFGGLTRAEIIDNQMKALMEFDRSSLTRLVEFLQEKKHEKVNKTLNPCDSTIIKNKETLHDFRLDARKKKYAGNIVTL
jgi:hypothetical protein